MPKADRRLDCDDGFEILNNIIITEYFFKNSIDFFQNGFQKSSDFFQIYLKIILTIFNTV